MDADMGLFHLFDVSSSVLKRFVFLCAFRNVEWKKWFPHKCDSCKGTYCRICADCGAMQVQAFIIHDPFSMCLSCNTTAPRYHVLCLWIIMLVFLYRCIFIDLFLLIDIYFRFTLFNSLPLWICGLKICCRFRTFFLTKQRWINDSKKKQPFISLNKR